MRIPSKPAAKKPPTAKNTPAPKKAPRARRKVAPVILVEEKGHEGNEVEEEETPAPQIRGEVEKPAEVRNILFSYVNSLLYPGAIVSSHGYVSEHKDNI